MEYAKDCLIYIWYSLQYHYYIITDKKFRKPIMTIKLCEELVSKYWSWIPHVLSFGENGEWYLNMLVALLTDSALIDISNVIIIDAMDKLIKCLWKQH